MHQEESLALCPICLKDVDASVIECHVSRCLFFTEKNKKIEFNSKRSSVQKEENRLSKKTKYNSSEQCDITNLLQSAHGSQAVEKQVIGQFHNDNKQLTADFLTLAEKMRPTNLLSYVGQRHVLGSECILPKLLNKMEVPNLILWGPPGCGKTSLSNIIANICKQNLINKTRFVKLSAATSGVNNVKEAVTMAVKDLKFGRRTIVFVDEIHHFNKLQQDIFLPHIETGTFILIGTTTENPSFSLNSSLLSRCRLIALEKLSVDNITEILKNAVISMNGLIDKRYTDDNALTEKPPFTIDSATIQWLSETCDGDARIALGGLEMAIQSNIKKESADGQEHSVSILLEDIKESLKKSHMLYDRNGDHHYDMISALHKSIRASDENASVYWLVRMLAGGEDPIYISRRLVRMSCEDIGLADPKALGIAVHTMHACKMIGMPECDVILAQCTIYLARASKSRFVDDALRAAQKLVKNHKGPQPDVPIHLKNVSKTFMNKLGNM